MSEKDVRFAMTLGDISDSESREAGVLGIKQVKTDTKTHQVLHVSDANGSWVPVKTEHTNEIEDGINNIIGRPQKDDIFVEEFHHDFTTQYGHIDKGTVDTETYYRRVVVKIKTAINMEDIVLPMNKNEDGWINLTITDKRGAKVFTRRWHFYNKTGGDFKHLMKLGEENDGILYDDSFSEPVRAKVEYHIPIGQYTGAGVNGPHLLTCIKALDFGVYAKRITTDDEPYDPSLIIMCKYDDSGNYTVTGKNVIQQFKEEYKLNYDKYKPYIMHVDNEQQKHIVIPSLTEHIVYTDLTFDNKTFRDVGKVVEHMLQLLIKEQNSVVVRGTEIQRHTTEFIKKQVEDNTEQDLQLVKLYGDVADIYSNIQAIDEWMPEADKFKALPVVSNLDLTRFKSTFMYKYIINPDETKIAKDKMEPVIYFDAFSPTDNSNMMGTVSSFGTLMAAHINKSEITDYLRREVHYNETLPQCGPLTYRFVSSPDKPSTHKTSMFGDADNVYRRLKGKFVCHRRTDIPKDAYLSTPYLRGDIICYDMNGNRIKTIPIIFKNGSTVQSLNFDGNDITIDWEFDLNGGYRYSLEMEIYWGKFSAWSDEVKLSYVACDGDDNSGGGPFSMNKYIFNDQPNRMLTRVDLHDASKYERNIEINGRTYGWHWRGQLKYNDNATWSIPRSANWWYTSWYGVLYEMDGCNYECKDWWTRWSRFSVTGTRNESPHFHYGNGEANNYSIMTSVDVTVTGIGDKAYYIPDIYKTPSFYFPQDSSHTLMLRGGRNYQFISSSPIKFRQAGTYEVKVGTYDILLDNTSYYGETIYKSEQVVIKGSKSVYRLNVVGEASKSRVISNAVPNNAARRDLVRVKMRNRDILTDKPRWENGVGLITTLKIDEKNKYNHNNWLIISLNNSETPIEIELFALDYHQYQLLYKHENIRVYMKILGDELWIMTYGISVKRMEIISKLESTLTLNIIDTNTNDVVDSYRLTKEKTTDRSLGFDIDEDKYYVNLSKEPSEDTNNPIKVSNMNGEVVGYLSK